MRSLLLLLALSVPSLAAAREHFPSQEPQEHSALKRLVHQAPEAATAPVACDAEKDIALHLDEAACLAPVEVQVIQQAVGDSGHQPLVFGSRRHDQSSHGLPPEGDGVPLPNSSLVTEKAGLTRLGLHAFPALQQRAFRPLLQ